MCLRVYACVCACVCESMLSMLVCLLILVKHSQKEDKNGEGEVISVTVHGHRCGQPVINTEAIEAVLPYKWANSICMG